MCAPNVAQNMWSPKGATDNLLAVVNPWKSRNDGVAIGYTFYDSIRKQDIKLKNSITVYFWR